MNDYKLNEQIALIRKKKGMTQEELAKNLGVSNQAVSKWESAHCCPDVQLLPQIADCFGVSIDELFGRSLSIYSEKPLWVMGLYDTGITAILKDFTLDMIPSVQEHMDEKGFLCIENHRMRGDFCVENQIYWVTKDEVFSFRQGDREEVEKASMRLCEKGIYKHII